MTYDGSMCLYDLRFLFSRASLILLSGQYIVYDSCTTFEKHWTTIYIYIDRFIDRYSVFMYCTLMMMMMMMMMMMIMMLMTSYYLTSKRMRIDYIVIFILIGSRVCVFFAGLFILSKME